MRENRARRAVAHAGDLDRAVFFHERGSGTAVAALEPLCFGNRSAQADGEVIREVVAADGNRAGVPHNASAVNDQFRGAAADVQQAAAHVPFVLSQGRFRGSKRFEDGVAYEDAGLVRGGNQILSRGDGRGHQVNICFQALANHADGVANAILRVHSEFMWKDVQNFAVFGKRDVACGIHRPAHVITLNVARTLSQSDATAAVYAAHVRAGHADHRLFHGHVRHALGFLDGAANRTDGGVEINNQTLAQALGLRRAERQKSDDPVFDFRDQDTCLCAADIQPNQVFVFFRQAPLPR